MTNCKLDQRATAWRIHKAVPSVNGSGATQGYSDLLGTPRRVVRLPPLPARLLSIASVGIGGYEDYGRTVVWLRHKSRLDDTA